MSANLDRGSARIYQFPAGGRTALGSQSYGEAKSVAETPRINEALCSDSWYHDEAIREARSQTKPGER